MKIIPFNQFKLGMENFKQVLIRYILRQCEYKMFERYIACSFACRSLPCFLGPADALSVLFDC